MTESSGPFQPVVPAHVAQPQDHRSADTFSYQSAHGTVVLPKFKKVMTFGRGRRLRHLDESELMYSIIEEVADAGSLAVLDRFDLEETQAFFKAWTEDSAISLGESGASSIS